MCVHVICFSLVSSLHMLKLNVLKSNLQISSLHLNLESVISCNAPEKQV